MTRSDISLGNRLAFAAFLACMFLTSGRVTLAGDEVGNVTLVVESVVGHQAQETRRLAMADAVHDEERINTEADSAAALFLVDGTELALGASAEIVLDEFVYDKTVGLGKMALNVAVGTMRFATGTMPKPSYEVRTPSAVISVRGTIFTLYVTPAGTTFIAVEEGAANVKSATGDSYDVRAGSMLRLDRAGRAETGFFSPLDGVDFADLFDGAIVTRYVQGMDRRLRDAAGRNLDAAKRSPRALGLVFAIENGAVIYDPTWKFDAGRGGSGKSTAPGGKKKGDNSVPGKKSRTSPI